MWFHCRKKLRDLTGLVAKSSKLWGWVVVRRNVSLSEVCRKDYVRSNSGFPVDQYARDFLEARSWKGKWNPLSPTHEGHRWTEKRTDQEANGVAPSSSTRASPLPHCTNSTCSFPGAQDQLQEGKKGGQAMLSVWENFKPGMIKTSLNLTAFSRTLYGYILGYRVEIEYWEKN